MVETHTYETGVNVIGKLLGDDQVDGQIIVSGHYDSIEDCPGADDNASGVAAVLEIARVLSLVEHSKTLIVACWDEEESGLVGSNAYAQRALVRGDQIDAVLVFETFAYYSDEPNSQEVPFGFDLLFADQYARLVENELRGDFVALVGDDSMHDMMGLVVENGGQVDLSTVALEISEELLENPMLNDLRRSDHSSFWATGVPAMMITDTANFRNDNYHCWGGLDTVDDLDHEFATQVIQAVSAATDTVLE